MTDTGKASLGDAISHLLARSMHAVIVSVAPHIQAERARATRREIDEFGKVARVTIAPIADHLLNAGVVHPLLEPLLRMLSSEGK